MVADKKVLLTTVPRMPEIYWDNFRRDTQRKLFTYSFPRINSFGLRFIKYNIPNIDILEYPSWDEYKSRLKEGYDIVGYSFYLNETDIVKNMVNTAKNMSKGTELWAGNYGALTPSISHLFDEIFIGYAELEVAKKLGLNLNTIKHPPLVWYVQTSFGLKINPLGILFTTRGCPLKCDFCQTPSFCKKTKKIPLDSIKEVIDKYNEMGIREVIIYDENFSLFPNHTKKVIELLYSYDIHWYCMTTIKHLSDNWKEWYEMGLLGAFIGIESFSQDILGSMNKVKIDASETIEFIKEIRNYLYLLGFFIIGFEKDTKKSVKEEVNKLKNLQIDHTQIRILTPLPETVLWEEIESKYGIFDKDWSKFDTMHLVWNHPNFTPEELRKLLIESLLKCHPRRHLLRTLLKLAKRHMREKGFFHSGIYLFKNMLLANTFDYSSL